MRWARGVVVASGALVLAGCAHASVLPQGLSDEEVTTILAQQIELRWASVYPTDQLPTVEVVEYINPFGGSTEIRECIIAEHVPGVVPNDGGFLFDPPDAVADKLFALAQYTCSMKYPYDPAFAEQMGLYSTEQLEYLYAYFTQRLEPCFIANGQRVYLHPTREEFLANAPYLAWTPYDALEQPETAEQWQQLDYRCPPPPIGYFWRAGVNYYP